MNIENDRPLKLPFPPFLVHFITVGLGFLIRLSGYDILIIPGFFGESSGYFLMIVSVGMLLASLFQFYKTDETPNPGDPTRYLLGTGLYKYIRNPMYLSGMLFNVGLAFSLHSLVMLAFIPVQFLCFNYFIIPKEEKYLMDIFGIAYEKYSNSTRRWF